jgi:hypothetical protein
MCAQRGDISGGAAEADIGMVPVAALRKCTLRPTT